MAEVRLLPVVLLFGALSLGAPGSDGLSLEAGTLGGIALGEEIVLSASTTHLAIDASQRSAQLRSDLATVETDAAGLRVSAASARLDVELEIPELPMITIFLTDAWLRDEPAAPPTPPVLPVPEGPTSADLAAALPPAASTFLAVAREAASAAALAAIAVLRPEMVSDGLRRYWPVSALFTRIPRSRVLDHRTRGRVYEHLRARPGLSLEEVADELGLSRSTARHHLGVLEGADLVGHSVVGRCRVHFPTGLEGPALRRHALSHPVRARIAELVMERPLTLMQLATALDANVNAVHFHIRKLREARVIERSENGGVLYRTAATGSP